ncbi:E3 ubiquitin-protein ligase MARCH2 [Thelohanellus kitauei]|uniref:E3 ubiquitin-protein ligase MARCH2 n=1 Tax=Thelohanellus kitauei TaxID=669202 RepID=A0A0C2MYT2_THEKT|nr:E3 ubiquitin-protein ligase MARCH2 [Thelohanellus kitauei]
MSESVLSDPQSNQDDLKFCKICFGTELSARAKKRKLISPCMCKGTMKYVHEDCLFRWMSCKFGTRCELCGFSIKIVKRLKPLSHWTRPRLTPVDVMWPIASLIGICTSIVILWFSTDFTSSDGVFYTILVLGK